MKIRNGEIKKLPFRILYLYGLSSRMCRDEVVRQGERLCLWLGEWVSKEWVSKEWVSKERELWLGTYKICSFRRI